MAGILVSQNTLEYAQAFTTGPVDGGYALGEIRLIFYTFGTGNSLPAVTLVSGSPGGTTVATLSTTDSLIANHALSQGATYTAPANTTLTKDTTYFVKVSHSDSSNTPSISSIASDSETGASGWSIANAYQDRIKASGATWGETTTGRSLFIRVKAPNSAPTVATAIPNRTAKVREAFSYAFPANTFTDVETTALTYTAAKGDATALPGWLTFTDTTRTFAGTPPSAAVGTLSVKVTAEDGGGLTVSDTFDIVIAATTPAAPGSFTATPGDTQAVLSWTEPDTGGAAISKYQVAVSGGSGFTDVPDGSDAGDSTGDETGYTVTGLANGTAYTFSVRALNSIGGGAAATATATPSLTDTTAPAFASAAANGTALVITMSETLAAASNLANSAFTVKKTPSGGTETTVALGSTAPVISASTVTLTLATTLAAADGSIKVSYTQPSTDNNNRLEDATGNETATFTDQAVTNNTVNNAATGIPSVTVPNVYRVPAVLGVDLSGIADTDGVTGIAGTATYQWVRRDGTTDTDISGATSSTYTLTADDAGKKVKVKVNFTDDAGNAEGPLTSAAVPAGGTVTAAATCPTPTLTGGAALIESERKVGVGNGGLGLAGFQAGTGSYGSLDDTTFDIDSNTYTITFAATHGPNNFFLIYLDTALSAAEKRRLTVHVCDTEFRFAAATVSDGSKYRWTGAGINWNTHAERTLSLSQDAAAPTLGSPTITGTTLTLPFNEALDTGSVPAGTTFTVTVNGTAVTLAASNAVAVAGSTVTLTLANAVIGGQTVTVSYVKPASNALQDTAGNATATFTDVAVTNTTNNVATGAPAITGTARVGQTLTAALGTLADPDGLPTTTFPDGYPLQWTREDADGSNVADISGATGSTYTLVAADQGQKIRVTASFTDGASHREGPHPSAASATVKAVLTVSSVAVTSTPAAMTDTYGVGETIRFTVLFTEAVAVSTSRPHFEFSLGPSGGGVDTEAAYARGTGTTALVFAYTVQAGDSDDNGIWIGTESRTLKLETGEYIRAVADQVDAVLTHAAPGTQVSHKVDGSLTPPAPTNRPPTFTEGTTATRQLAENPPAGGNVGRPIAATDADGDTLLYALGGADAANFDLDSGNGQLRTKAGGDYDTKATHTVTVTVSDGNGGVARITVTIRSSAGPAATPGPVPDEVAPPVAPAAPTVTAVAGSPTSLRVTWTAPPGPAITSYALQYRAGTSGPFINGPQDVTGTRTTLTGLTPGTQYQVHVRASSAAGDSPWSPAGSGTTPARNTPPVFTRPLTDQQAMEGHPFTYVLPADAVTDADGDPLTYAATTRPGGALPAWLTFDGATRTFTGTPRPSDVGTVPVTVTASDGRAVASDAFDLTVLLVDPSALPGWLSRFGRTVGTHVTDAVGARLRGAGDAHVTVGGYQLPLGSRKPETEEPADAGEPGAALLAGVAGLLGIALPPASAAGSGPDGDAGSSARDPRVGPGQTPTLNLDLRRILLGSAFQLPLSATDTPGAPRLTAWGRVAGTQFTGREGAVAAEGDVLTGTVGVDGAWARWLAGLAVAHSRGDGTSRRRDSGARAELGHSLTSLHPYLRYAVNDRLDVWGLLGYGWGEVTVAPEPGQSLDTETQLAMGAFGGRGQLVTATENGGLAIATRTEAMFTHLTSEAGAGLAAADAAAHRLRVVLEGSRRFTWEAGQSLTPAIEVGVRRDWGDAETGFGLELGGRMQYADPAGGFLLEGALRGLVAHEDEHYGEWGASGALRIEPGPAGQGLSLTLAPTWGAVASGVQGLWTRQTTAGLAPQSPAPSPGGQVALHLGYGLWVPPLKSLVTPFTTGSLTDAGDSRARAGVVVDRRDPWGGTLRLELAGEWLATPGRPPDQTIGFQVHLSFGHGSRWLPTEGVRPPSPGRDPDRPLASPGPVPRSVTP